MLLCFVVVFDLFVVVFVVSVLFVAIRCLLLFVLDRFICVLRCSLTVRFVVV